MRGVLCLLATALSICSVSAADQKVPVTTLTFTPDGTSLLSNASRSIEIRSPQDATIQSRFACDLAKITCLTFHPKSATLAAAGGEPGVRGAILLFDWPSQKLRHRLECPDDLLSAIAFSPDGTLLASAGADHIARIWKFPEATPAFSLTGHAAPVLSIAFTPNGESIVTASADRSIKVWSAKDGMLLRTFTHHLESVNALAFRPGLPATCATASDDRTVRVWQPETGRMVRIIRNHRQSIQTVTYSADSRSLFAAGREGIIRQFEADSDILTNEWNLKSDWIYTLTPSPDGKALAAGDWSGTVHIIPLPPKK